MVRKASAGAGLILDIVDFVQDSVRFQKSILWRQSVVGFIRWCQLSLQSVIIKTRVNLRPEAKNKAGTVAHR